MRDRTVPPNPYQGDIERQEVQTPDAYLMQMNRQLGENTTHLKSLMVSFTSHVEKEEKHIETDNQFKAEIASTLSEIKDRTLDSVEQKEWLKHQIDKDKDKHTIIQDSLKKVVSGTVWAGLIGIGSLLTYGVVHLFEKIK